jgi:hypothetical protein
MVSSDVRLGITASYPGLPGVHGAKQVTGPIAGDTSFYLGPWSELSLTNLIDTPANFKVVWSEMPGGND